MLHELLVSMVHDFEVAMIVVTHNRALASRAHRILMLEGGRLRDAEASEVGA
jgi:predicted ABC-type transport system involved in lysophospholipase L1 biosynthesis ATPase subunit